MPATQLRSIHDTIRSKADLERAASVARFFKTSPGQYGAGDKFLGIAVPVLRKIARTNRGLLLADTLELLHSPWHEERLVALLILVDAHERAEPDEGIALHRAYLANTAYVNNWDLVDTSAEELVGTHINGKDIRMLERLGRSKALWERRIAIIATFATIKQRNFQPTLAIAERLLGDEHDLIHKAVGWMLREVGNRDIDTERAFLERHAATMPRTALRYAIEKFTENERKKYMAMR
ncbi:MAG: alkylation repair enzyme [Gemmatimonadetes bacterium]|nr:alkylation repair enzyme [Gemmatimonadota bacterium]